MSQIQKIVTVFEVGILQDVSSQFSILACWTLFLWCGKLWQNLVCTWITWN